MNGYDGGVLPPTHSTNYNFLSGIVDTNVTVEKRGSIEIPQQENPSDST
jgi:hypothetical protein